MIGLTPRLTVLIQIYFYFLVHTCVEEEIPKALNFLLRYCVNVAVYLRKYFSFATYKEELMCVRGVYNNNMFKHETTYCMIGLTHVNLFLFIYLFLH